MLYSSCKNPVVDQVEALLGMQVDKKVSQPHPVHRGRSIQQLPFCSNHCIAITCLLWFPHDNPMSIVATACSICLPTTVCVHIVGVLLRGRNSCFSWLGSNHKYLIYFIGITASFNALLAFYLSINTSCKNF